MIDETSDIYAAHPKVKPLELALIAAAAVQEATEEEFELACQQIKRKLAMKASGVLLSELQRRETGESVLASLELQDEKTKETIRAYVSEEEAEHLRRHLGF